MVTQSGPPSPNPEPALRLNSEKTPLPPAGGVNIYHVEQRNIPNGNKMDLTEIQNYAIQARMAFIVGAGTFDRVFAGIRFAEIDGHLLYVYARDESSAAEIEDNFALPIAIVASQIVGREINVVVVLPKVLQ
ncbi:hypothetical protein ACVI1L_006172 [Bradyrhizobium sp. USDA 4516]|uniref:hypothetical protein n=1 Tax=Bradyrhizobium pachyrhizi TaxID=280333 RepID=UPI001FD99128|nr:hypothetical protein [Bradyrhizobium pachyrhizi]